MSMEKSAEYSMFNPIDLAPAYNRNISRLQSGECSEKVLNNKDHLLTGSRELWGIPFELGTKAEDNNVILLKDQDVTLTFSEALHDKQLIFLHAADFKESHKEQDGIIRPMMGTPRLGEIVCAYTLQYADGSTHTVPIRRRYEISEFQVMWGENSFDSVKHIQPRSIPASTEGLLAGLPVSTWGHSQVRVNSQGAGSVMHHWLYTLDNPYPEKSLISLTFHPVDSTAFIFGITRSSLSTNPLRWEARRKVRFISETEDMLSPFGAEANIRIDMGAVISVSSVLDYAHDEWENGDRFRLPTLKKKEWIIEYTSHPDASFILGKHGERKIPVNELVSTSEFTALNNVFKPVTLRVIEQKSGQKVHAKIHLHGQYGEYLAPVNGHRIPNPYWFEDYGVEHAEGDHYSVYIDGEAKFKLPLGKIYIEISKGFEFKPVRKMIAINEETSEITVELEQVLPWRQKGWVSADTHVHFLSPQTALLEGAAEGVNVVNLLTSQWGELFTNLGDFDGKTTIGSKENGGDGEYLVRVGTENRQHILGHISLLGYEGSMILPLCTGGPDESALGDPLEATLTQWAEMCRAQNGIAVLPHMPHPRAEGAAAIVLGEIDAVEMCSLNNPGINPYSLSDWYRYLNCGYHVPAVGGTDKMSQATAVGTIRTYALLNNVPFTYDNWMDAVRKGTTFVTYGPLMEFYVNGHEMGTQTKLSASGGTLDISWQVSSVTIPVTKIELVVNGELREVKVVDPNTGHYAGSWSLQVKESCWIAIRIRGAYTGESEVITAHSSAVMVIVDEQKCFNSYDAMTILEQIEGSTAYVKSLATKADERTYKQLMMKLTSAHHALHHRMHHNGVFHRHTVVDDHHH